jgi:uncharacterized protein
VDDEDVIVVVGVGAAAAEPDGVRAVIGLSLVAPTVAEALTDAAAAQSRVVDELATAGIDRASISTTGYQAGQDYEASPPSGRHRVDTTLEVRLPDVGRVGEVLSKLGDAAGDALRVHGVFPDLTDPGPARQAARADAVQSSHRQAEELAAAAGRSLGRLRSLVEGGAEGRVYRASSGFVPNAGAAPELEAGRRSITVAVTATYELLPP